MIGNKRRYTVTSVTVVTHTAEVWAEDAESARRQADGHLRTMVTMESQSGAGYNGNIDRMASGCDWIDSHATEATDAS